MSAYFVPASVDIMVIWLNSKVLHIGTIFTSFLISNCNLPDLYFQKATSVFFTKFIFCTPNVLSVQLKTACSSICWCKEGNRQVLYHRFNSIPNSIIWSWPLIPTTWTISLELCHCIKRLCLNSQNWRSKIEEIN